MELMPELYILWGFTGVSFMFLLPLMSNCLYHGLLILDVNSEHIAHALRKIGLLERKSILSITALDLIKCLTRIKKQ